MIYPQYFESIQLAHGMMGKTHDWFCSHRSLMGGPIWDRIENCDRRNLYEAPGRHIFWVHEATGTYPYRAVMDDFGNLVRVPE